MEDDEEGIFDTVTWETANDGFNAEQDVRPQPTGPGFRQSTGEQSGEPSNPHDPKWEGYLIPNVKDPIKELQDTKDAYVSYLVVAQVSPQATLRDIPFLKDVVVIDGFATFYLSNTLSETKIPRFQILKR